MLSAQKALYLHKQLFKQSFCCIDLETIINYNINEKGIVITAYPWILFEKK